VPTVSLYTFFKTPVQYHYISRHDSRVHSIMPSQQPPKRPVLRCVPCQMQPHVKDVRSWVICFSHIEHGCPMGSMPFLQLRLKEHLVCLCLPVHTSQMPKHWKTSRLDGRGMWMLFSHKAVISICSEFKPSNVEDSWRSWIRFCVFFLGCFEYGCKNQCLVETSDTTWYVFGGMLNSLTFYGRCVVKSCVRWWL